MSVTGDGLRVELLESEKGAFFQSASPIPTEAGKEMIALLARQLGDLPNDVLIAGHTDARPFSNRTDYSNWELSAGRANAARRLMETSGLRSGQVLQVRGFASQHLRDKAHPESPSNRRISIIVRYLNASEDDAGGGDRASGDPSPDHKETARSRLLS